MDRSHSVVLMAAALVCGATAAYAGPCTEQISQFEQQLKRIQAAAPPGVGCGVWGLGYAAPARGSGIFDLRPRGAP